MLICAPLVMMPRRADFASTRNRSDSRTITSIAMITLSQFSAHAVVRRCGCCWSVKSRDSANSRPEHAS